jgi:hypothetical protein
MNSSPDIFEKIAGPSEDIADALAAIAAWCAAIFTLKEWLWAGILMPSLLLMLLAGWIGARTGFLTKRLSEHQLRQDLSLAGLPAKELLSQTLGLRLLRAALYPLSCMIILLPAALTALVKHVEWFEPQPGLVSGLLNTICLWGMTATFPLMTLGGTLDRQRRLCQKASSGVPTLAGHIIWPLMTLLITLSAALSAVLYGVPIYLTSPDEAPSMGVLAFLAAGWVAANVALAVLVAERWQAAVKALYDFE